MAGRRPLTHDEEWQLLRAVRTMKPRDRALVTFQWMTGFRISECLSLTVGSVLRNGELVEKVGVAPRYLKGHYGKTRWIPVLPELTRALQSYLGWLRRRLILSPDMPLFLSRQTERNGNLRPLSREAARMVIQTAMRRAGIEDDGRLGTHSLRKTWAANVYKNSGRDIMVLKAALGHSDVSITQKYLEVEEDAVLSAIRRCDFTRTRRIRSESHPSAVIASDRNIVYSGTSHDFPEMNDRGVA